MKRLAIFIHARQAANLTIQTCCPRYIEPPPSGPYLSKCGMTIWSPPLLLCKSWKNDQDPGSTPPFVDTSLNMSATSCSGFAVDLDAQGSLFCTYQILEDPSPAPTPAPTPTPQPDVLKVDYSIDGSYQRTNFPLMISKSNIYTGMHYFEYSGCNGVSNFVSRICFQWKDYSSNSFLEGTYLRAMRLEYENGYSAEVGHWTLSSPSPSDCLVIGRE